MDINLLAFVIDSESETILNEAPLENCLKEGNFSAQIFTGTPEHACNYLKNNPSPNVLIIDLSNTLLPLLEVEKLLKVCKPSVNIIALGQHNDVGISRQLMAAGVSAYLIKPLNPELLIQTLKEVIRNVPQTHELPEPSQHGHIISFLGTAGGVGTSTFAANCGISMAEDHKKNVSIVDYNLTAAPLAQMLNIPLKKGLIEVLENPKNVTSTLLDNVLIPYGENLDILSADGDVLSSRHHCAPGMRSVLALLTQRYNYVFVDCSFATPMTFKELTFKYSDIIVIVCDLTFASVRETSRLIAHFKKYADIEQKIIVLANKANQYTYGEIPQADYEIAIDYPITFVAHFDPQNPLEALNAATPLIREDSPCSAEIKAFTNYLLGKSLVQKKTSFLQDLFN